MNSICSQCGGKLNIQISPQIIQCPYCGSSVEVYSLPSKVWTLKPIIEKNVAWQLARVYLDNVKILKGYLIPFFKGKYFLPVSDKCPKALKANDGEREYTDELKGFIKLSNNKKEVTAYMPYWYAESNKANVWISAIDGFIIKEEEKKFPKKLLIKYLVILLIVFFIGFLSIKTLPISIIIFILIFSGGLIWLKDS